MNDRNRIRTFLALATAALGLVPALALADSVADFYKGKNVEVIIGSGAGGDYDAYGRLLGQFMSKYLPGHPTFLPVNMPGAGSLKAANSIYNLVPKDGTAFGTVHRFIPLMPLFELKGPQFDALKFTYLGSMNRENTVCISWKGSGIDKIEDAKTHQFTVGTTGAGAELTTFNATLHHLLGLKLKVVSGYKTSLEVDLAIERGELQGRCGVSWGTLKNTHPEWLTGKKINILIQLGLSKNPELPDVPLFGDLVTNPLDRQALKLMLSPAEIGRPFFGPPGIPADRVAALRKAFDAAVKDPALIAEAKKGRMDISPVSGTDMQQLIARDYQAPKAVIERARELVSSGSGGME